MIKSWVSRVCPGSALDLKGERPKDEWHCFLAFLGSGMPGDFLVKMCDEQGSRAVDRCEGPITGHV